MNEFGVRSGRMSLLLEQRSGRINLLLEQRSGRIGLLLEQRSGRQLADAGGCG